VTLSGIYPLCRNFVGTFCISIHFGLLGAFRGSSDFKAWPSRDDIPFVGKWPPSRQSTQLRENKQLLEEERCQSIILKEELRNQLLREADSLPVKEGVKRDFGRSSIT